MKTLGDIGEFGLIDRIARLLPGSPNVIEGIGDDCAVVRVADHVLLISSDLFIEDIHFRRSSATAEDIGWKAAAAGLSDIAAMGGQPLFGLVALSCPADTDVQFIEEIYHGIANILSRFGAVVVGGDTSRAHGLVTLDVTVIGESQSRRFLRRKGACSGDLLVVSGFLGQAAAGLHALEHGQAAPDLIDAHLHPKPRLAEGQWLCNHPAIHAMIDISDGLLQDAGHLAAASRLGVNIDPERLPVSPSLDQYCRKLALDPTQVMLTGGEDYELAFAVDAKGHEQTIHDFHHEFRTQLTAVGEFTDEWEGVRIGGAPTELSGHDHFKK